MLRYMTELEKVEGWLSETTAHVIRTLLQWQTQNGVAGDVMEIGVHHGRLFLILCISTMSNEKAFGVDLFDLQHLNVDASGKGDYGVVVKHLEEYAPNARVELIKGDSVAIADQLRERVKQLRFISVDGGHTRTTTCSDLLVAETVARDGAIVSLDDIYRVEWSGVTAGLARYFAQGGKLVPFCVSPNKVHLTTSREWGEKYCNHLSTIFRAGTNIEFFEFDDVITVPEDARWRASDWLAAQLPIYRDALQRANELKTTADKLWEEKNKLWQELQIVRSVRS